MIDRINRLLSNRKLSPKNREALLKMREQHYAGGGAVYKNIGGAFATGAAKGIDEKIRKALKLGVPEKDVYRTLRNNALRARNAQVRGALLGGGLSGAGKAAANQAGLITQAGLGNQPFKPQAGALDAVGQGIADAGQATAQYEGDLANISRQKFEDRISAEKLQHERDREARKVALQYDSVIEALKKTIRFTKDAIDQLAVASEPGTKGRSALTIWQQATRTSYLGDIARNLLLSDSQINHRLEIMEREAFEGPLEKNEITQRQASGVRILSKRLINMAHAILSAQPGVKTDADFEFAQRGVANLYVEADSIHSSLVATLKEAELEIDNQERKKKAALGFTAKGAQQAQGQQAQQKNVGGAVLPAPKSERDYNALPSGASYMHPEGDVRIKS